MRSDVLPIFYINMSTRPDRRAYMETQLAALGLLVQRIEAVTPSDISADDLRQFCNPEQPSFLRPNELGCTLSHERAWRSLIESGADRALILEDDIELSDLLPAFLAEVDGIDADLIRIETTGARTRVYPATQTGPSGISVRPFRSTPMGSAGYVISARAARRLVGDTAVRQRQLDLALYSPFANPGKSLSRVLADPALCRQLNMTDQKAHEIARSDIAGIVVSHVYAQKHPLRFFFRRLQTVLARGLTNSIDHFAQRSNGLVRKVIPFHKGGRPL